MPIGINLLPRRRKKVKRWPVEKLKAWIVVILALYVIGVVSLLGFSLFTARELSQVKAQKAALERKIKEEAKKETLAVLLKDRLSKEEKILKAKINYKGIFEVVNNLSAPEVLFDDVEIERGKLSLSGEATNLASLKDFLDRINASANDFSYAEISSVARTKTGGYTFSLETILSL